MEVPNFVHDNPADSQGVSSSAHNPCSERVGRDEQFSAVLRDPENSCEAAQPFVHQQQTESGIGSFEQFGADGVRSHFTQNNFLFLKSKLLALSQ